MGTWGEGGTVSASATGTTGTQGTTGNTNNGKQREQRETKQRHDNNEHQGQGQRAPNRRTFFIVLVQGLFDFGKFAISDQGFVLFHLGNAPRQFDFQILLDGVTVGVRSTNFIPQSSHGRHCLSNQFIDGDGGRCGEGGHCWRLYCRLRRVR